MSDHGDGPVWLRLRPNLLRPRASGRARGFEVTGPVRIGVLVRRILLEVDLVLVCGGIRRCACRKSDAGRVVLAPAFGGAQRSQVGDAEVVALLQRAVVVDEEPGRIRLDGGVVARHEESRVTGPLCSQEAR